MSSTLIFIFGALIGGAVLDPKTGAYKELP